MQYKFPLINSIDDVLPSIKDRDEFVVSTKDHFTVINYHVALEDSFPSISKVAGGSEQMREERKREYAIRRELRGIIFGPDGKILARRFHKFFNMNEREETLSSKIDLNQPHIILDKLDGSMISPVVIDGYVRWTTKMGITDTSMQCEQFVALHPTYTVLAYLAYDVGITPIFEYIAPINRIVIPYEKESLVLLAMRDNVTGEYAKHENVILVGKEYDIPVVKTYEGSIADIKNMENIEGIIIKFNDGHMVKVKSDWYVSIHKAKDNILFEKNIIKLILEEKLDDVLPHLLETDQRRLTDYKINLLQNISMTAENIETVLMDNKALSKKDFALTVADKLNGITKSICFRCWESGNVREELIKEILKKTNSQTAVDSVRKIIGVEWR